MSWDKPEFSAGAAPTGLQVESIADQTKELNDAEWTTYTPTWTASSSNPSIGNGTLAGLYRRPEGSNLVHTRIRIAAGSTTTFGSGFWSVSLGIAPSTASQNDGVEVAVVVDDSTGNTYPCTGRIFAGNLVIGTPSGPLITGTAPMTWATSDELRINFWYEPAT